MGPCNGSLTGISSRLSFLPLLSLHLLVPDGLLSGSLIQKRTGLPSAWTYPEVYRVSRQPEAPVPLSWGRLGSQGGGSLPASCCCRRSLVKTRQGLRTAEVYPLLSPELGWRVKGGARVCGSLSPAQKLTCPESHTPCIPWVMPHCYLSKSLSQGNTPSSDWQIWLLNQESSEWLRKKVNWDTFIHSFLFQHKYQMSFLGQAHAGHEKYVLTMIAA